MYRDRDSKTGTLGEATPLDRAEWEIRGYREALNEIHTAAASMTIASALMQHLHATIQRTSGDAGQGASQHGYEVGRYVSLERIIEGSRDEYYEALRLSSDGWHDGEHDLGPWLSYFLTVIRRAYRDFEERVGQVSSPRGAKRTMVLGAIGRQAGTFTLIDLERLCPGVSRDMIRRVLWDLLIGYSIR